jgi:predicted transcriptional regulator
MPVPLEEEIGRGGRRSGDFQAAKEGWLMTLAAHPNLSGADYAVAIVIAKHLNSTKGTAWPSLKTIAELSNRKPSTVWRSVERLSALGLLKVQKSRGRNKSNIYQPLYGEMARDPKTLRRRTRKTANSKQKDCELAVRTLEEV